MNLNPEELKELESFAALFFTLQELAIIMQVEEAALKSELRKPDSVIGAAIQRGRLLQEAKLRQSIIDLATQGSSPAQAIVLKIIQEAKMSDL